MLIYKYTSKTTGKSYIGQTGKTLEERFKNHCQTARRGSAFEFHTALQTYGSDDFESEILEDNICTQQELDAKEMYYIKIFDTYKNGYNMTEGGNHVTPNVEKMVKTRQKPDKDGLTSFKKGAHKAATTRKEFQQEIIEKGTKTRRDRGDFARLADLYKGSSFGSFQTCEYCGKKCNEGNYKRWHGNNCKQNPTITDIQLGKRIAHNKGQKMSDEQKQKLSNQRKGFVICFDTINGIYINTTKEEFDKNENLVGTTNLKGR